MIAFEITQRRRDDIAGVIPVQAMQAELFKSTFLIVAPKHANENTQAGCLGPRVRQRANEFHPRVKTEEGEIEVDSANAQFSA